MIEESITTRTIKLTKEDIEKIVISHLNINNEYEIIWSFSGIDEYQLIIKESSFEKSFVPLGEIKQSKLKSITVHYGINICKEKK